LLSPVRAQDLIAHARTETASAALGLVREIARVSGRPTPSWIGYRVAMAPGDERRFCDGPRTPVFLESAKALLVLARVDGGAIVRVRLFTPDCEIDAGGMPLVWLNDVTPDESVAWLSGLVTNGLSSKDARARERIVTPGILAISQHDSSAAVPALIAIVRATEDRDVRAQGIRWLARSQDPRAKAFFEDVLTKR
jgi:hypothetical protein